MSLATIRTAVVDTLRDRLPAPVKVDAHGGRFDGGELKRVSMHPPGVYVAVLGFEQLGQTDSYQLALAAYLITADRPGSDRGEEALLLANTLQAAVKGNDWGHDQAEGVPERISGRNLYGASIDRHGIAMWALSWRQRFELFDDEDPGQALNDFITYHGEIDVDDTQDGEPAVVDTVELPQE